MMVLKLITAGHGQIRGVKRTMTQGIFSCRLFVRKSEDTLHAAINSNPLPRIKEALLTAKDIECWYIDGAEFAPYSPSGRELPDVENDSLSSQYVYNPESEYWEAIRAKRAFLEKYCEFIMGDWATIAAFSKRVDTRSISLEREWKECNMRIFLQCVDAAYWNVYTKDLGLGRQIESIFGPVDIIAPEIDFT